MKPNSDWHYNQMPNNEPFREGLGYMVSLKIEEYHELIAAKERLSTIEAERDSWKETCDLLEKRLRKNGSA
jgi:hypothetical protein